MTTRPQRVTAFDRWSMLKTIAVFSVLGLIIGPTTGFTFRDQLAPISDPYLAPIRNWLGVTTTTVPIPTFPPLATPPSSSPGVAPMAPDPVPAASRATSAHAPALGQRGRVAVPAVMPAPAAGSPGTATVTKPATTVTVTQTPPKPVSPPTTTKKRATSDLSRADRTVRTTQDAPTSSAPRRVTDATTVSRTTEPRPSPVGTRTVPPSTSDSPSSVQLTRVADSEPDGSGSAEPSPSTSGRGTPTQSAPDPAGDVATGAGAGTEPGDHT